MERQLYVYSAVIQADHLVLTSGKHSSGYINLRVLAGHTGVLSKLGGLITKVIDYHENHELAANSGDGEKKVAIVGPETLGRTLATFAASASGVFDYFAWCSIGDDGDGKSARWNEKLNFAEIISGARCYIVDDLLTTAVSVEAVKKLIESTGGEVAGVVVVVRRDVNVTAETIGVPWLLALLDVNIEAYEPDDCPLCKARVPMRLRPGHGHEWIKKYPGYPVKE